MKPFLPKEKKILLVNSFGLPIKITADLLAKKTSDASVYISYPLGVLTLAAWCIKDLPEFTVQILDIMLDLHKHKSDKERNPISIEEFIQQELNSVGSPPDIIGISLNFSNGHTSSLLFAKLCKQKWPKCVVVVGGMHATTFSEDIILDRNIDYLIRGPGDISFTALIKALEKNTDIEFVPGVVTDVANITKMGSVLNDLDSIPHYPYELLDMEYLVVHESTSPVQKKGTKTGMIFMSRGCPFPCTYCSAAKVHGKNVFIKSVNRIVDEIQHLINEYKVTQINIVDDLFGANKKHFYELFEEIDRRNLKFDLSVPAGLAITIYNEEMIDVLVKHGLKAVNLPLESGSKHVQEKIILKRVNIDKGLRLLKHATSRGVFTGVNIVIGSPGETKEHMEETFEFLKQAPVDWVTFFIAYPYPQTTMTNILLESGEITKDQLVEIWDSSTQGFKERPFDTKEISGKDLYELVYHNNIKINFFNNYNIRNGSCEIIIPKLEKIIKNHEWHVVAISCLARCHYELGEFNVAISYVKLITDMVNSEPLSKNMYNKYYDDIIDFIKPLQVERSIQSNTPIYKQIDAR
jgi:radical SAM superfamily enzyme YgiQ (UPF0313 family)